MDLFINTYSKNYHLVPGYATLFNRHWDSERHVKVLCYEIPNIKLPDNFKWVSMGPKDMGWADGLRTFFTQYNQDCFFLCQEDHYLIDDVNLEKIKHVEETMLAGADKVYVSGVNWGGRQRAGGCYSDILDQSICAETWPVTVSAGPSYWRKELFLALAQPGYSIWDFECRNTWAYSKPYKVYYPTKNFIYEELDAHRTGGFDSRGYDPEGRLAEKTWAEEDSKVFEEALR